MSQGGDGHTLSTSYMQAPGGCVHVGLSNSHQIPTWSPPIPARPRGWSALRRGMQGSPLLGCPGLGLRGLLPTPPHPEEQNRDLNVLIKGPESCGLKQPPRSETGEFKGLPQPGRQASRRGAGRGGGGGGCTEARRGPRGADDRAGAGRGARPALGTTWRLLPSSPPSPSPPSPLSTKNAFQLLPHA